MANRQPVFLDEEQDLILDDPALGELSPILTTNQPPQALPPTDASVESQMVSPAATQAGGAPLISNRRPVFNFDEATPELTGFNTRADAFLAENSRDGVPLDVTSGIQGGLRAKLAFQRRKEAQADTLGENFPQVREATRFGVPTGEFIVRTNTEEGTKDVLVDEEGFSGSDLIDALPPSLLIGAEIYAGLQGVRAMRLLTGTAGKIARGSARGEEFIERGVVANTLDRLEGLGARTLDLAAGVGAENLVGGVLDVIAEDQFGTLTTEDMDAILSDRVEMAKWAGIIGVPVDQLGRLVQGVKRRGLGTIQTDKLKKISKFEDFVNLHKPPDAEPFRLKLTTAQRKGPRSVFGKVEKFRRNQPGSGLPFDNFDQSVDEQVLAAVTTAFDRGIPATRTLGMRVEKALLKAGRESNQELTNAVRRGLDVAQTRLNTLLDGIGPSFGEWQRHIGDHTAERVKLVKKEFEAENARLYPKGLGKIFDVEGIAKKINKMVKEQIPSRPGIKDKRKDVPIKGVAKNLLWAQRKFNEIKSKPQSIEQIRTLRTEIRNRFTKASLKKISELNMLSLEAEIGKTINTTAKRLGSIKEELIEGGFGKISAARIDKAEALLKANQHYKEGIRKFESPTIQGILSDNAEFQGQAIYNKLARNVDSFSQVLDFLEGAGDEESAKVIKRSLAQDLIDSSLNNEGLVDMGKLMTNIRGGSKEINERVFGKEGLGDARKIARSFQPLRMKGVVPQIDMEQAQELIEQQIAKGENISLDSLVEASRVNFRAEAFGPVARKLTQGGITVEEALTTNFNTQSLLGLKDPDLIEAVMEVIDEDSVEVGQAVRRMVQRDIFNSARVFAREGITLPVPQFDAAKLQKAVLSNPQLEAVMEPPQMDILNSAVEAITATQSTRRNTVGGAMAAGETVGTLNPFRREFIANSRVIYNNAFIAYLLTNQPIARLLGTRAFDTRELSDFTQAIVFSEPFAQFLVEEYGKDVAEQLMDEFGKDRQAE